MVIKTTNKIEELRHGDKVIVRNNEKVLIEEAIISINHEGTRFICSNNNNYDGSRTSEMFGYRYSWAIGGDGSTSYIIDIIEQSYNVGDIIINEEGDKRMILGKSGKVYFVSHFNDFSKCGNLPRTKEELDDMGWELVDNNKVEIIIDGETVMISKESAEAMKKALSKA